MTDSMKKLLEYFYRNKDEINVLLSLGVIDKDKFADDVIEMKNPTLIYEVAKNVKDVPIGRLVEALMENVEADKHYMHVIRNLPQLLSKNQDQDKIINAIITFKNFSAISEAQRFLNYKNPKIIESLLNFYEQDDILFRVLFDTIAKGPTKYIPSLVVHMYEVFSKEYLLILLHPSSILKIEKSLDEESAKSNSMYLNVLFNLLNQTDYLMEFSSNQEALRRISKHHSDLFSPSCFAKEDWNEILDSCKNIVNKILTNSVFIASLDEEKKFNHLMELCRRRYYRTISNNLEQFRSLFQSSSEDTSLQKGDSKTKKLTS